MKNLIFYLILFSVVILHGCKKYYGPLPVVSTTGAGMTGQRTASAGGQVIDSGGLQILCFGVCWSKSHNPTVKDGHTTQTGDARFFIGILNGLTPGTTYYVRAYATTKAGTGYGNEATFESMSLEIPEVYTDTLSYINAYTAVCLAFLWNDGGDAILAKGVCWSTNPDPTLSDPHTNDGTGTDRYWSHLEGLTGATTYYVRAYATNSAGTGYGANRTFTTLADSDAIIYYPVTLNPTLSYGTVTDADFNSYRTITIGSQTWMAENLRVEHYRSGAQIGNGGDPSLWPALTEASYIWYNNDTMFTKINGALYNWYAVNTGLLCPVGWHVATQDDYTSLINYLGGESVSGAKLKETGTHHWLNPNTDADNNSGFTAVPAGGILAGTFTSINNTGYIWTATESSSGTASLLILQNTTGIASLQTSQKSDGASVRCIKN